MTTKNSEAKRKYWAKISPEERREIMRKRAKQKAKKMTPKERSDHGKMMKMKQIEKRKKKLIKP